MSKKLEDTFGIHSQNEKTAMLLNKVAELTDEFDDDSFEDDVIVDSVVAREDFIHEANVILDTLTVSEKIDNNIELADNDDDAALRSIEEKALGAYEDLCDIGLNVPDTHVGKVYEVAAMMLKTALDARNSKVSKKLKILELQIKKMKADHPDGIKKVDEEQPKGANEFDRNELLKRALENLKPKE